LSADYLQESMFLWLAHSVFFILEVMTIYIAGATDTLWQLCRITGSLKWVLLPSFLFTHSYGFSSSLRTIKPTQKRCDIHPDVFVAVPIIICQRSSRRALWFNYIDWFTSL